MPPWAAWAKNEKEGFNLVLVRTRFWRVDMLSVTISLTNTNSHTERTGAIH